MAGTRTGEVAIVTGAIRDEGTSRQYLPLEFPAVADPDVVGALRRAARSFSIHHRMGISHTKDSFFGETEKVPSSLFLSPPDPLRRQQSTLLTLGRTQERMPMRAELAAR